MRVNVRKILIVLLLIFLIILVLDRRPADGQFLPDQQPQCMYPARPLIEGRCDNTDPCDPERIKIDGGRCVDKDAPAGDIEPSPVDIEPTPVPTELPDTGPGK